MPVEDFRFCLEAGVPFVSAVGAGADAASASASVVSFISVSSPDVGAGSDGFSGSVVAGLSAADSDAAASPLVVVAVPMVSVNAWRVCPSLSTDPQQASCRAQEPSSPVKRLTSPQQVPKQVLLAMAVRDQLVLAP